MLLNRRIIPYLISNQPFQILLSRTAGLAMTDEKRWVSHYSGPETPIQDICEQFSKYQGGKIELSKDEESGVATITINHPERRNALSGIHSLLGALLKILINSFLIYSLFQVA